MNDDYKDVSGLLEEDVSKVSTDEKVSVADKIDIGDKIELIKPIKPIKPIRMPKFAAMRTMAEYSIPTPVTRKEMYLNVIAGGVSALPTPITREEIYLAKICGMDVTIPIPLTRYEMYLYALSGGEWDVPVPVTRLEKYLYHNCGYEIEVPEPITREEIYWFGGQPVPEVLEGIPPLTFTAKRAGALVDYRIDGNSVQDGTPTLDNPIEPEFVGELVTEGEYAGQYKIPISSAGQTKNIYLGQVQTTRQIKKLVLTGEETKFQKKRNTEHTFELTYYSRRGICSHYREISYSEIDVVTGVYTDYTIAIMFTDLRFTELSDFKSYLAAQYAAGTPVTLWYAWGKTETGIVNEPLARIIGKNTEYVDSVNLEQAGVEIPVTAGANTLSVGTEIQPSNMMISYK